MNNNQNTQLQEITSSTGTRCVATYAGTIGDALYFECKDPITNKVVGFIARNPNGICGPLCGDYLDAAMRLRNIIDTKAQKEKNATKVQPKLVVSSAGTRCIAIYAGNMGDVKYFDCVDPKSNRSVGYIAQTRDGRCGPLCADYGEAILRLRNITERNARWWNNLFFGRQK